MISKTLGCTIHHLVWTTRVIGTLGLSGLLNSVTLLSRPCRIDRWLNSRALLSRINRLLNGRLLNGRTLLSGINRLMNGRSLLSRISSTMRLSLLSRLA